jgi:hypothetical protein
VKKDFLNLETKINITWTTNAADIWTDAEQYFTMKESLVLFLLHTFTDLFILIIQNIRLYDRNA